METKEKIQITNSRAEVFLVVICCLLYVSFAIGRRSTGPAFFEISAIIQRYFKFSYFQSITITFVIFCLIGILIALVLNGIWYRSIIFTKTHIIYKSGYFTREVIELPELKKMFLSIKHSRFTKIVAGLMLKNGRKLYFPNFYGKSKWHFLRVLKFYQDLGLTDDEISECKMEKIFKEYKIKEYGMEREFFKAKFKQEC